MHSWSWTCLALRTGKPDDEQRPLGRLAVHLDGSSHFGDDPVSDEEAQAGPLAGRLGGEKRLVDPPEELRRNPDAAVVHLDLDRPVLGGGRYPQTASTVLHGLRSEEHTSELH